MRSDPPIQLFITVEEGDKVQYGRLINHLRSTANDPDSVDLTLTRDPVLSTPSRITVELLSTEIQFVCGWDDVLRALLASGRYTALSASGTLRCSGPTAEAQNIQRLCVAGNPGHVEMSLDRGTWVLHRQVVTADGVYRLEAVPLCTVQK